MSCPTLDSLVHPVSVPQSLAGWKPSALDNDSRRVGPDTLFLAYRGAASDGRDYLEDARRGGAKVALVEPGRGEIAAGIPLIEYPGLRQDLGKLAGRFYDWPDRHLPLAAVTGTAGKTTSAWLVAQILQRCGRPCGYLGTLGAGLFGTEQLRPLENTTPDALRSRRMLRAMLDEDAVAAVLEASSEGLEQSRLSDLEVEVAAFTNLGSDHIEAHGGVEGLKAAKRSLFDLSSLQVAVINLDDPFGAELAGMLRKRGAPRILGYGRSQDAVIRLGRNGELSVDGHLLPPCSPPGEHNLYNLACAVGMALGLGVEPQQMGEVLSTPLTLPRGRMQQLFAAPDCYVDYAHSPEALEAALRALRALCDGELWCVFGCGGERDVQKRPLMGTVASRLADHLVITQDNSRGEDPGAIVAQILAGIGESISVDVELDRRQAIHLALDEAGQDDLVLIAGKGHEHSQLIGGKSLPFSDISAALDWRRRRKK